MDPRFRFYLRPIAAVVLVFFSWVTIEPWNYAFATQAKPGRSHSSAKAPQSATKSFDEALRKVKDLIEDLDLETASGRDITLTLETLKGYQAVLARADQEILAEFVETKAFLDQKNLLPVIHDRHATAVGDYKDNYQQLQTNLKAILKLEAERKRAEGRNKTGKARDKQKALKDKIKVTKGFLEEKVKKPRHQPLDPNNLPHRVAKPTKKKPRMTKETF